MNRGKILVFRGTDHVKKETFFRPLGGGVEFNETSENALIREIQEELGLEIRELQYLGTLENIFVYQGKPGHEVVLIYDAQFVDPKVYAEINLHCVESDGEDLPCEWLGLEEVERQHLKLYPNGLYPLLMKKFNQQ